MRASSAKAKGRKLVQEFKNKLLKRYSDLESDDLVIASAGQNGEDLQLSPKAREHLPYSFEMKNQESLNIWKALEQAESHSEYPGVLVFRRNRSKTYVSMEVDAWLNSIRTRSTIAQSRDGIEHLLGQLKTVESRLKLMLMSTENL